MEDHALFTGVDDLARKQGLVFLNELLLVSKRLEGIDDLPVHRHCRIVVRKAAGFGNRRGLDALSVESVLYVIGLEAFQL